MLIRTNTYLKNSNKFSFVDVEIKVIKTSVYVKIIIISLYLVYYEKHINYYVVW